MKPAKAPPATAIVAGGGIIGLACALQLQARGVATVLVNHAGSRPASWGNAGHIAVEQVEPLASFKTLTSLPRRLFTLGGAVALPPREFMTWLPFTWRLACASFPDRFARGKTAMTELLSRAVPAWRRLARHAIAGDCLVEDGHYVVWETEKSARRGRGHWQRTEIGTAGIRDLNWAEAAQISSLVARTPVDGLCFTGTARVRDPGELLDRLAGAFASARGESIEQHIEGLMLDDSHASVRLANGQRLDADLVVLAAGAGSAPLLRPLGIDVPLIAERGYHIQADAPGWPDMPPVVFEDRSMIVSRFESGLRAASFVEFARADAAPDPRKWQRLLRHAGELDLPFSSVPREWMGARPTLPDYLPAIGRSRRAGNLVYAFGHQHLGLTLAAITGELVAALAMREAPDVDLAPFDIERF